MKDDADISFYIVGGGVNEVQLKTFAKEKELNNVTFVGMQPPEEVTDFYAAADANVIPLQKGLIYAALPSKTADCLIAGKPIITCVDEESIFSKTVNDSGYQNVAPTSEQSLKEAIQRCRGYKQSNKWSSLKKFKMLKVDCVLQHCLEVERV